MQRVRLKPTNNTHERADRKHRFKKGEPRPEKAGRAKGTPNKVTVLLKEAILTAAEKSGFDGQGREGAIGYLTWLSRVEPAVFGRLLEKLLPYQLTGKDGGPINLVHETKDALIQRMRERGLPLPATLIDVTPTPMLEHKERDRDAA